MKLIKPEQQKGTTKRHFSADHLQFVPGIWINQQYYWLQDSTEKVIYDEELIIKVKHVPIHSKIRFSKVLVSNHSSHHKQIKFMGMHYFPNIDQNHLSFISPTDNRIFHLSQEGIFLVNGRYEDKGIQQYTTMPIWNTFTDKIWSSLQTGTLKYQPMAKGPAASIYAVNLMVTPHGTKKVDTWTIAGTARNEVVSLEHALLKNRLAFPFEK